MFPLVGYGDESANLPQDPAIEFASVVDALYNYRMDKDSWPLSPSDLEDYAITTDRWDNSPHLEYEIVRLSDPLKVKVATDVKNNDSAAEIALELAEQFPDIVSDGSVVKVTVDLGSVFEGCISDEIRSWSECSSVLHDRRVYIVDEKQRGVLFPSPWVPSPTELATRGG